MTAITIFAPLGVAVPALAVVVSAGLSLAALEQAIVHTLAMTSADIVRRNRLSILIGPD